jgi:hypothetical protein
MLEELTTIFESTLTVSEIIVPVLGSLAASILVYLMYQIFYGSTHIGAGVNRTFLIGGPTITMIFLFIQTSVPLGLGLLGALSFVRFRTPVKDPAEIGFLLLLIATSVGMATGNYLATAILLVVVFIALGLKWLLRNRVSLSRRGHLMISVDQESFPAVEKKMKVFLGERLRGLSLETMSTMDDRVGLHYQYQRQSDFDWSAFTTELNELAGTAEVEVYIG